MNTILKRFATLLLVVLLLGILGATAFVTYRLTQDTSASDAEAIVGGRLESGYPAAAFLLARSGNGSLRECGAALISGSRAITAAHCVDQQTANVFVGIDRPDAAKNLVSTSVNIHPGWSNNETSENDLAVVTLADVRRTEPARVSQPTIGCNYLVVGYGEDKLGINGLRKSADVCIDSIDDRTITMSGVDGTACFGDSGSPVFRKDTNEVVAVVSQILTTEENPCAPTDSIRATRIDANLNAIYAPEIDFEANNVDQPISLDLRLVDQTYLGEDQYQLEISGEIVNNTKDTLSELAIDWCINDGDLSENVVDVLVSSLDLQPRPAFGEDRDCRMLLGTDSINSFSRKSLGVTATVEWNSRAPMPVDMLVSATVGDDYRVFSLSNNRDVSQIVPNSSTLLISLNKPLINPDNQSSVQSFAIGGGIILLLLASIKLLKMLFS